MIVTADPVTFRRYHAADFSSVASLWTRINRELAPVGMEQLFEQYIAMTIDGELKQLLEVFSEAKRNAFWVVENVNEIVESFGIEGRSVNDTELRRMYLDEGYRGLGIAQRMLDCAQAEARALGFAKIIVSTAQFSKPLMVLSKERISADPNGSCGENDRQAGGRRLDPFPF